jgi:hypothetical protein
MAFMDTENAITSRLASILNLPLTIARDAGNMKNFQFGAIRPHPSGKGKLWAALRYIFSVRGES